MEGAVEDVVIVGAGIAGLATALGLHKMGIRSSVLESADRLRSSGFALATWSNAWRALDALGIRDVLREQHVEIQELVASSAATGLTAARRPTKVAGKLGVHEVRCVRRDLLLKALHNALPEGTIRLSSKVVSIEDEEDGWLKVLHLADGSTVKTMALVGCDGVNSAVAKWLGLKSPLYARRSACRGIAEFPSGHGFKAEFLQYNGDGFRSGFVPCDDTHIYWFFTWSPAPQGDKELEENPAKLKQFVLSKLGRLPPGVLEAVARTDTSGIIASRLRYRSPLELLWGRLHKDNVCLAGDAFHAMTPDLGQGGCSALEDGVVLSRCLGGALLEDAKAGGGWAGAHECDRIESAVEEYAKERKWRCFGLVTTAYVLGVIQQSGWSAMNFLRDRWLAPIMARKLLSAADYDFGRLPARK